MTISPDQDDWYELERDIDPAVVHQLRQLDSVKKLSLSKIPLVTAKLVQRLSGLRVEHLWLRDVTRGAMRHILQLPGLRALDVLCIKGSDKPSDFRKAKDLMEFRCANVREADLMEVAQCTELRELGAQGAELSAKSIAALLSLPNLSSLDLEATCFNDSMARQVSRSRTINFLQIGATRITRVGLEHLVTMKQLWGIDLWATKIVEDDLQLLLDLPNLEYISLGHAYGGQQLDTEQVTRFILDSPSLKQVWLDRIRLEASQKKALEAKLERLTCFDCDQE